MDAKVVALFTRAQQATGKAQIRKILVDAHKLRQKATSFDEFFTALTLITNNLLVIFKREPAVERCVDVLVRFVAGDGLGESQTYDSTLLNSFVKYITELHDCKDKAVRFRVCQIASRLLHTLPDEAELDEQWFDALQAAGMVRITDKIPAVRMQAANMLTRLQDPTDAADPITAVFFHTLEKDSSPDVRRCVLIHIAPSKASIPAILAATRDKAATVRKAAYLYIKQKVAVAALRVEDRLKLLEEGLADRDPDVRKECISMLCTAWLDGKAETNLGGAIALFKQLDVVTATDTCLLAATEVIDFVRDWPLDATAFASLDCETAFFWRALIAHANGKKDGDTVEMLTPAVPSFAMMLQKWGEHCSPDDEEISEEKRLEVQFIAEQLLWIARDLDYADEAGRSKMTKAIHQLLLTPKLPESVVASAIELLKVVCSSESDRLQLITEVINDLRHPIERRATASSKKADRTRLLEITRIKLRLNECKMELDEKVGNQEFAEAGKIKETIQALEQEKRDVEEAAVTSHATPAVEASNDPTVLVSCLLIAKQLLLTTCDSLKRAELTGLMHTLVIPGVKSTDPDIRCGALACLGMCLVLAESPSLAQEHLQMFLMILSLDQDIIKKVALKAIFDAILAFGVDAFRTPAPLDEQGVVEETEFTTPTSTPAQDSRSKTVVQLLLPYMHNDDEGIRTIAVEGFARLMLQNHVTCPSICSQLVELYFNPMTKDDQHLQQCLSVFFPAYAFSSSSHAAVIEAAFLPTLRKVLHAPSSSPLHVVKDSVVAKFFVYHTKEHEGVGVAAGEESIHASLGTKILNEMLSDPTGADTRVLSSILSMLSLDNCSDLTVQNLTVLTEMLIKTVSNRVIKRKFVEFLDRLNERGAEALSEEQIAEVHTAMAKHRDEREVDVGSIMGGSATPRTTRRTARKKRPSAVASRAPAKGLDLEDEDSSEEDADEYEDEDDEVINEGEQQLDLEPEEAPASEVVEPGTPATDSGEADKPESEDDESESEEEVYELEELLETRKNGRRNEYLVKWKGFGAENNTWEPTGNLPAAIVKAFKAKMAADVKAEKESNRDNAVEKKTAIKKEPKRVSRSKVVKVEKPESEQKRIADLENEVDDLLADTPCKPTTSRGRQKAALSDANADLDFLLD